MKYYWISDTKYVISGVNCLYSPDNAYALHRKPHDNLYKKSGQWGIAKFCTKVYM